MKAREVETDQEANSRLPYCHHVGAIESWTRPEIEGPQSEV